MLVGDLVREPEIWRAMRSRFPWVEKERGDIGEGLIHLDFAALRRGVEGAADSRDVVTARDVLDFVEQLLDKVDTLHPEVVNALDVSFLEDLYLSEPQHRDFAVSLLGPKSRGRWKAIAEAHERRSSGRSR